jgi:hypothetical protein
MNQIESLLHLLNDADARLTFAAVWSRRVMAPVAGVEAPFASLDDLIAMKKAAGRPKDIEDLRQLEKLRKARSADNGE